MSIDVEDWFHDANLERAIPRHAWDDQELRIEESVDRMLETMSRHGVQATCFVLGWLADRKPDLVRRIADAGHEIASHGQNHQLVYHLEVDEFRADVQRSKDTLEEITGRKVVGYRAPNFSLTDWALDVLADVGFEYDSSLFPTSIPHDRYGKPETLASGTDTIVRHGALTEVSMSCLKLGPYRLPWAGGGYFRLLPYRVFKLGIDRIVGSGKPFVFYIHPWEIDVGQPRIDGLSAGGRFRHYLNLRRAHSRWDALLGEFSWTPIADLIAAEAGDRSSSDSSPHGASATHDTLVGLG